MTKPLIVVTRSKLIEMRWETQGQIRGGTVEPRAELFHLWFERTLLGFASDFDAAILLAERYARQIGAEIHDATLETSTPEERQEWVPPSSAN